MNVMLRALALSVLLLTLPHAADAQNWPTRPIRVIVTQAAGGTPDIICRLVTDRLARVLGQQVIVENRPGGGNVIGAQAVARATPDGYTFLFATAAALVTNPHTFKSLPYDALRDFVPVSMVASGPFLVLAHPSVPAKTLPELIAHAKANPGTLSFAIDGPKNFSGMIAAWLNKLAGTQIAYVPYSAMPQGIQDTVAGRVQLVILAIPSAAPHVLSGALRPLAISSRERMAGYEGVAPIAQTFPGFDFTGWMVLAAPAGTPTDVVERVNRELAVILKDPEVVTRLKDIGFFTDGAGTPASTAQFVRNQYDAWAKLVREIGVQPE